MRCCRSISPTFTWQALRTGAGERCRPKGTRLSRLGINSPATPRAPARVRAARERKKAATGKCGGRKSYAEAKPETVALARELRDQWLSLRKISAELAKRGHLTASGKPYVVTAVWAMLH